MPPLVRVPAILLVAVALLSACRDGADSSGRADNSGPVETPSSSPTPGPSPSPSSTLESECSNALDVMRPKNLRRGSLTGDLDGDGSDEEVRLAIDESGPPGCQVFVVAQSSSIDDVAPIDDPNISFDLGLPALDSIKSIGFGRGGEVVLVLSAGASTQFFGLVSVVDGDLVHVTIDDGPYGNVFPYGGSVSHLEASDCATPDADLGFPTIVISSATSEGKRYRLERRFFGILDRRELVSQPDLTEQKTVSFEELVSYPEFGEAPFAHCR